MHWFTSQYNPINQFWQKAIYISMNKVHYAIFKDIPFIPAYIFWWICLDYSKKRRVADFHYLKRVSGKICKKKAFYWVRNSLHAWWKRDENGVRCSTPVPIHFYPGVLYKNREIFIRILHFCADKFHNTLMN